VQAKKSVLALLCAGVAAGQTLSSSSVSTHSGWSFSDTTAAMTDVVVGDIVARRLMASGRQVAVTATVRVVRVLQGDLAPGTDLTLAWQYPIGPPEAVADQSPTTRGLWFLRRQAEGFEPLVATLMPYQGGYFLELPQAPLPGSLLYLPGQPAETKIACELAWALQDLAPRRTEGAARTQFQRLAMALNGLDPKAAADVYRYLSSQGDANLEALGLQGRMAGGDASAVFELEKDLPRLAPAFDPMSLPPTGLNLAQDLPAAHAVARIAVGEITIPGWEGALPMMVASTRSLEFLPYFDVMLVSEQSSTRDAGLLGFCQLLNPAAGAGARAAAFWKPEMQAYCPMSTPMSDIAAERQDVTFWQQWYDEHLLEIRKVAMLPQVIAPARYNAPPRGQETMEVTMEMRFQAVISMSVQPPSDPFSGQLNPSDREIFQRIVETTRARLDERNKLSSDIIDAARMSGAIPDEKRLLDVEAQRQAALRSGLADLENQLSPDGWKTLEAEMKRMALHVTRLGAPPQ
jgi:hypothetical protein